MPDYEQFYELNEQLNQNERLIASGDLFDINPQKLYATVMARLAEPLPTGEESPFSSQQPGTAHGTLVSNLIQLLQYSFYELNLSPDKELISALRLLGTEIAPSEFPVLNMRFWRSQEAIDRNISVTIPGGLEIGSKKDPELSVFTYYGGTIEGTDEYVDIPARLNVDGIIPATVADYDFQNPSSSLPFVSVVENTSIISRGRNAETLYDAVLRTRGGIRTGNLGKFFENGLLDLSGDTYLGRCVGARDYLYYAKQLGAEKAAVLPGFQQGAKGYFSDLVTIAVYPDTVVSIIKNLMLGLIRVNDRIDVIPPDIIPLSGTIKIKANPTFTTAQCRDLAIAAITENINPPNGVWGDKNIDTSIIQALQSVNGFFAVPSVSLIDIRSGDNVTETEINPWSLFEVRDTIQFEFIFV